MVRESLFVGFLVCALPLACGESSRRQGDRDVSGAGGDDDGGGKGGSAGLSAGRAGAAGRAGSASGGAAGSSGGGASASGGAGNAAGMTSAAGSGEGGEGATSESGGSAGSAGGAGRSGSGGGLGFVDPAPAPGSLHDLPTGDTLNSTPPILLRFEDGLLIAGYTSDPALAGLEAFATDQVAESFVARLDRTGERLWSKPLPGSGVPIAMKLDPEGNIVIVAAYLPDRTRAINSSFSTNDLYLAKLRPNGDMVYARDIPYDDGVVPYGLVVDAEGASYVCGGFIISDGTGSIFTFLAKYDPDGDEVWVKKIAHTGTWASADGIALLANGDIAITGGFNGTIDFGGGELTTLAMSESSSPGSNGFIARFTPEGEHVESTRFGGTVYDSGKDLVALSDGDLLVSGSMIGISEIGGKMADGAEGSPFVARLDPEGAARWVAIAHTSGAPYGLVADPDEQTFHLTGWFGQNTFLYEFGPNGEVGRGFSVNGSLIWSNDIAVDSAGSLWVSGGFQYTIEFENGISLTAPDKGVFLVRLERETR